jgi:hypothetical protein
MPGHGVRHPSADDAGRRGPTRADAGRRRATAAAPPAARSYPRGVPRRRTNLLLFAALLVATATGAGGFAVGTGWNRWLTVAHGVAGCAIVLLVPWKAPIVRRGLRRRPPLRAVPSLALALVVAAAVVSGVAHAAGARDLGAVTTMQVHVGAALTALPLAAWHVVVRPVRPRRDDLSRRELLRVGALGLGAGAAYGAVELLVGVDRRFTGSHEVGSHDARAMPVTQWLDDDVPRLDVAEWRLQVGDRRWRSDDLAVFDDRRTAVLDCTGGWWSEQSWEGIALDRLLAESGVGGGRSIVVRSITGYERRLPHHDAGDLLLATRLGGAPLSRGHGAPARLVAPGRRGFWWVKWVTEIRVDDRPWWLQAPFPLT